jgi:hypothetical protein
MAPVFGDGWLVKQVLLRDLRVDRGALRGAENEKAGRNEQHSLDGKNDRNLTRKGMLQHELSSQTTECRCFDLNQSRRFERGK